MHRFWSFLTVIAVAVLASSTTIPAGEPTPEDYIHFMKPLVGSWKTTSEEDGSTAIGSTSYQLLPNGHCFLARYQGGDLPDAQSIEGYDPVAQKHTVTGFDGNGSFITATVDWGANLQPGRTLGNGVTGTQTVRVCTKDGTTFTGTATVKCTTLEQGKVVLEYVDRTMNGTPVPDLKITMEATPAERLTANSSTPALFKEYADLMVGEWECKAAVPWGTAPETGTVPARATCSRAAGGAALEWDLRIGEGKAQALTCWDPASNQLKGFGIGANGMRFETVCAKEADKWITEATLILPDGRRTEIRTVTTFEKDGNTHVNEYPTYKDVFTRVKR